MVSCEKECKLKLQSTLMIKPTGLCSGVCRSIGSPGPVQFKAAVGFRRGPDAETNSSHVSTVENHEQ